MTAVSGGWDRNPSPDPTQEQPPHHVEKQDGTNTKGVIAPGQREGVNHQSLSTSPLMQTPTPTLPTPAPAHGQGRRSPASKMPDTESGAVLSSTGRGLSDPPRCHQAVERDVFVSFEFLTGIKKAQIGCILL